HTLFLSVPTAQNPELVAFKDAGDLCRKEIGVNGFGDITRKAFLRRQSSRLSGFGSGYGDDWDAVIFGVAANLVKDVEAGHTFREHQVQDDQMYRQGSFEQRQRA